jgi:hypothetical protein
MCFSPVQINSDYTPCQLSKATKGDGFTVRLWYYDKKKRGASLRMHRIMVGSVEIKYRDGAGSAFGCFATRYFFLVGRDNKSRI